MLNENIKLVQKLRSLVESSTQTKAQLQVLQILDNNSDELLAEALIARADKNCHVLRSLVEAKQKVTLSSTVANSKEGTIKAINFTVLVKPTNEIVTPITTIKVMEYPVLVVKFASELIETNEMEKASDLIDAEVFNA